jgi:hypothetical protein
MGRLNDPARLIEPSRSAREIMACSAAREPELAQNRLHHGADLQVQTHVGRAGRKPQRLGASAWTGPAVRPLPDVAQKGTRSS